MLEQLFLETTQFLSFVDIPLIFTITAFTWAMLFYTISYPKKWVKILTSQIVAVICCIIWYFFSDLKNIKDLILNAALAILAYEWLIKAILIKLGIDNYNKKAIIGRKNNNTKNQNENEKI